MVVQRRRYRLLDIDDIVVAHAIQFVGGDTGADARRDHAEHLGGQLPSDPHLGYLVWRLYGDRHAVLVQVIVATVVL